MRLWLGNLCLAPDSHSTGTAAFFAFTALSIVPALAFFVFGERRIPGEVTGAMKA